MPINLESRLSEMVPGQTPALCDNMYAPQPEIEIRGNPADPETWRGANGNVIIRDRASGQVYEGCITRYSVEHDTFGDHTTARMEVYSSSTATNWIIEHRLSDITSAATYGTGDRIIWRPTVTYSTGARTWVMDGWDRTYTATTTAATDWDIYYGPATYRDRYVIRPEQIMRPVRVSPEERARREAQERQWEEERKQREEIRKIAEGKAEKLLLALLTPEQQADYKEHRRFFLQVNGQMFRIDHGHTGNVKRVDPVTREVTDSYCIHPSCAHGCPDQDVMLAQKLMLETDPEQFVKSSNHYRVPPRNQRAPAGPRYQGAQLRNQVAYVNFNA